MRAYDVGVKGWEGSAATVFAETAGKAKYRRLLDIRDPYPDVSFKHLTCRALGDIPVPPTRTELAQREADAFNATHPIGTLCRYWSGEHLGHPTGVGLIYHLATVVSEHAVAWIKGAGSCHSLSHVEAV